MKALSAIIAPLIFASVGVGQPSGTLRGIILCDDTHAPARGANVYLQSAARGRGGVDFPEEPLGTVTDLDGTFTISNIPPGEYYVVTVYAGYISARDYIFPGARSPELTGAPEKPSALVHRVRIASGDPSNITIRLQRGASIKGRVRYSDGTPVPNVALTPKMKLSGGSFADVLSVGANHTDSAGHYGIDGLPDGSYAVLGAMEGPAVPVFGGDQLGASGWIVFAGGGMRSSTGRVIDVKAPNEYTGVDLTIPLVGVYEVSGKVVAPDGHRLNHAEVRLYPTDEARFSLATPLQAEGTFSFNRIPPDTYTLAVEDASDLVLIPKSDRSFSYQERAVAQRYGPASTTVSVHDGDVTDVTITTPTIR